MSSCHSSGRTKTHSKDLPAPLSIAHRERDHSVRLVKLNSHHDRVASSMQRNIFPVLSCRRRSQLGPCRQRNCLRNYGGVHGFSDTITEPTMSLGHLLPADSRRLACSIRTATEHQLPSLENFLRIMHDNRCIRRTGEGLWRLPVVNQSRSRVPLSMQRASDVLGFPGPVLTSSLSAAMQ